MLTPQTLAERFCRGEYVNDVEGKTWRVAFEHVDRLSESMTLHKIAIHTLWTVNGGHLRRKIQDDALILRVLKKTMPGYQGVGLILYRGECQFLYTQNKIGFCWSPKIEVATLFARGLNAIESGGVLLRAYAPPGAILTGPNNHSAQQMEEFEYTCDPARLQNFEVLQCFPKP